MADETKDRFPGVAAKGPRMVEPAEGTGLRAVVDQRMESETYELVAFGILK
jgi:hypothetical protein